MSNRGRTTASRNHVNMDVAVILSSLVAFVLYWNTLDADFAYDDSRAIKTNQDLLPSSPVAGLFSNDFWGTPLTHSGSHKSYRPLCVLSFRLNYYLGEFEPSGYHLGNILLHALVTGIFTHLSRIFLRYTFPTFVAGLLFASHPVHTEAVAGVVGRADVGACLFFLVSLLCYMKYCKFRDKAGLDSRDYHWRWIYLSAALFSAACSMLTKEHGITVLAVCASYDILVHFKLRPKDVLTVIFEKRYRGLLEGLTSLMASLVILVCFRIHLMGSKPPDFAPADNPAADSDSFLTRTLTFLFLPTYNFWLLLCPRWLSFDWSMEAVPLITSPLDFRNVYTALFYTGLGHLALYVLDNMNTNECPRNTGDSLRQNGHSTPYMSINHNYKFSVYSMPYAKKKNGQSQRISNGYQSNGYSNHTSVYPTTAAASCWPSTSSYVAASASELGFLRHHSPMPSYHLDTVIVSLTILVLPFIPATNLFFYVGFVVAERVLYIPSMGFCLLIGLGAQLVYRTLQTQAKRRTLIVVVGLLVVIFCIRTVRRNRDWVTEENLYRSGIPVNPPKAFGNLANILSAQGKKEEAEWAYKKALSYRSNMADVHYNLGILLQEQKRHEEALQSYRLAIQFRPRMAMAHLNLGLVLGILGRKEEAAEVYRHCSQLDGTGLKDPKTHESTKISALFNLGRLFADDGKYEEAIEVYKEAVRKMPGHYQPQSLYNMLGEAYFKLERYSEAEHWYKEALRVKPDHIPAHLTYGKMLAKLENRVSEAEQWFNRAKLLAPNDSSVYQHYGQFLSETERHAEAAMQYVRAAELAPDEYEIIFNAANTLRQAGQNEEAEKYYRMAVKLRPNEATSHMNLGAMLHVNGKLVEAEMSYLEALRLKPDDSITQNNLQKLRNLLNKRGIRTTHVSETQR